MNKMTWEEAKDYLKRYNISHKITDKSDDNPTCKIAIVIKMKEDLPESSRTYIVTSNQDAFIPEGFKYPIYGDCIDLANKFSDYGVRLENRLVEEGGDGSWSVDYCYIKYED